MSPDELFAASEVAMDSPRLAWLKRHGLETDHLPNGGQESPETGDVIPHWVCRVIKPNANFASFSPKQIGAGDTADEACADFAVNAGMKLWNEEVTEKEAVKL